MKLKFALLAISAAAMPTQAFAQDGNAVGGFRIEAVTGWDNVVTGVDENSDYDDSSSGLFYGIGAGYDFAFRDGLIGVEVEIADSTVGSSIDFNSDTIDGYVLDGSLSLDASKDIYVGARAGYAFSDAAALYVKGGYSFAGAELVAEGTVDGAAIDEQVDFDFEGIRVGAGLEANLTPNVYTKLEYRYTAYNKGSVEYAGTEVNLDDAFDYIDLDRHQVVVGVGYRF